MKANKKDLATMQEISERARMRRLGYGPGGPSPRPPIQKPPLLFQILSKIFS